MGKIIAFLFVPLLLLKPYKGVSQDADLLVALKEILFHKEISEKVSLDLSERGGNKTVYIMADTIFQRINAGILERLQQERGKVVLMDHKSTTIAVINDPWFYLDTAPLFVLFKAWEVGPKQIKVTIRTSSLYVRRQMKDKYITANAVLVKENDTWQLKQIRIEEVECCDNIFGEIEIRK